MTISVLYGDELRGMARSKVMLALWIGLPAIAVLVKVLQPDTEGIPLLTFVAILIGSIGGTLSAVLMSTTITGERSRHVYDLFLVRPVTRTALLLAKYFAVLTCLIGAAAISLGMAAIVDVLTGVQIAGRFAQIGESFLLSLAAMLIASSAGVLFGVLINSIAVSAILSVYLGNQLSALIVLPAVLIADLPVPLFAGVVGTGVPAILLSIAILVFRRKAV
jgi:ABC-2 type transport system permease protein